MSRGHNQTRAGVYSFALFGVIPFDASSCLALKVSALYKIHASPKEHLDVSALILSQLSPTPRSSPQLVAALPNSNPSTNKYKLRPALSSSNQQQQQQPQSQTPKPQSRGENLIMGIFLSTPPIPFLQSPLTLLPPQNSPRPTASRTPSATPSTPTPRPPKNPPSTRAPGSKTRATSRPSASPRPRSSRWSPTRAPAAPSKSWA